MAHQQVKDSLRLLLARKLRKLLAFRRILTDQGPGEMLPTPLRAELAKDLGSILDLERLLAKVTLSSAGPRDLAALARSLAVIPSIKKKLEPVQAARLRDIASIVPATAGSPSLRSKPTSGAECTRR